MTDDPTAVPPAGPGPGPYSAPFRVRFDEAAPDGRLRTSNVLRYAQDLAWLHSAALGFGRDWYAEHQLTWLVRAAELAVIGSVGVGSALTGTTRVVGFRRVWSRRRSEFHAPDGSLVAWVHIDWVLIDARGAPTRIPASIESMFGTGLVAQTVSLGRVALGDPPPEAHRLAITVRPQELDPMDHVNNAVYADWLDEAVIAAGDPDATREIPRHVAIEYAAAAAPSQPLDARTWPVDDGWAMRLIGADGTDLARATLGRRGADMASP